MISKWLVALVLLASG